MEATPTHSAPAARLSWREGLYLVGPDPLTSPYYSSGALLLAGVGYATPVFQIGLYLLLFLLAPLYVEAVLLTLSNGGTYVMTRYALSRFGKIAIAASALVGIIISFSYVATAIVSMLAYSDYVQSLSADVLTAPAGGARTLGAIVLSALAAAGFGVWVMPRRWRSVVATVVTASLVALVLSTVMTSGAVVMLAPLVMLFRLNNEGLRESVKVSKTIFLINIVVMGVTILLGLVYLILHGVNLEGFTEGATLAPAAEAEHHGGSPHGRVSVLPGLAMLSMPMLLAGAGSSILGASGVESVMNIPEELARPRQDVRRIYRWMLSLLLLIGGSTSLLLFTVLPPEVLASKSNYLLAALGDHVMAGVTGSEHAGRIWQSVIVATAALMLIGATNTGFAGARGLWLTMARDNLLPTSILKPNLKGAYERAHWVMFFAIFALAMQAEWSLPKLERWYGATFGLVMFSGMVAFVLLRKYRSGDARAYTAPWNVKVFGMRLPVGALVGLVVIGYALLSMYSTYRGDIGELRTLVLLVSAGVGVVLLLFNHRTIMRRVYGYFRRVVDTVEPTAIETQDRTAVVAVGEVRYRRILDYAFKTAKAQGIASGRPYRQLVAFHMTPDVKRETIYEVVEDGVRPAGIPAGIVRIYSDLSRMTTPGVRSYLVLMPPDEAYDERRGVEQALAALGDFHERHEFRGHLVFVGSWNLRHEDVERLNERLHGSTLVTVPLFEPEAMFTAGGPDR